MINFNLYNRIGFYFEGLKFMVDCFIMVLILFFFDVLELIRLLVYE